MKALPKLLITLAAVAAFSLVTILLFEFFGGESETTRYLDDVSVNPSGVTLETVLRAPSPRYLEDVSVKPSGVGVPDGGSTFPLLGFALLGVAVLRRKLGC